MTIRQQGGIFGRNPTFNNLEVDGTMAVDGAMSVGGLTTFYNNVTISKTSGTALSLLDSDGGFAAATLTVENGGRDLAIFATQDIIFDQSGLETARFLFGGGLTFNGDTAAANALDDYEEGTYSVTLHDSSSTGNASSTTTTGYYTKVGRVVTCSFANLTDISTAGMTSTNVLYMSLPFSAAQDASGSMAISSVSARQATGEGYVVPVVVSGNSRARFYGCRPDNAVSSIRPAELTSGTSDFFNFTMTYIAS